MLSINLDVKDISIPGFDKPTKKMNPDLKDNNILSYSTPELRQKLKNLKMFVFLLLLLFVHQTQQFRSTMMHRWRRYSHCHDNMPPPIRVSSEKIISVLKKYMDYFSTADIPKYSSEIWKQISLELDHKWSAHNVYTNVKQNRNLILSTARKEMGIVVPQELPLEDISTMMENFITNPIDPSETDGSMMSTECGLIKQKKIIGEQLELFDLVLSEQEWQEIEPDNREGKVRLKPKVWTNIIAIAFWKQFRLPCAFSFKRAEVKHCNAGLSYSIQITGSCKSKTCNNSFHGYAIKTIDKQGLVMEVATRDTRFEPHEEVKRFFNGKHRKDALNELKVVGASGWRRRQARQNMLPGDNEPPFLPKQDVLRQAKKQAVDLELSVKPTDGRDVIRSIEEMSLKPEYVGFIQNTSSLPFYVFYSTPTQLHAYKEFCRYNKSSSVISVDATGSLVQKLTRPNGTKSGHIFLYVVVINFEKTTLPVHQLLSETHTTEFIEFWLKNWLRKGAPKPKEAVCDYSRALLSSLCGAFNNQTLKSYVNTCFSIIVRGTWKTDRPPTLIRVDVAHLIHLVCRWKCFRSVRQTCIKEFFVRCIALMVECTTLAEFEEIFNLTCATGLQTHEDSKLGISSATTAKEARGKLEKIIAGREINVNFNIDTGKFNAEHPLLTEEVIETDEYPVFTSIQQWIDDRVFKSKTVLTRGENLNPFYSPECIEALSKLAKEFPLWTSVGMDYSTLRASSSYVESYFNDLKTRTLQNISRPIRVDKFLKIHARDIIGTSLLFSSKLKNYNIQESVQPDLQTISTAKIFDRDDFCRDRIPFIANNALLNDSDLLSTENWRGKVSREHTNCFNPEIETSDDFNNNLPSSTLLENIIKDNAYFSQQDIDISNTGILSSTFLENALKNDINDCDRNININRATLTQLKISPTKDVQLIDSIDHDHSYLTSPVRSSRNPMNATQKDMQIPSAMQPSSEVTLISTVSEVIKLEDADEKNLKRSKYFCKVPEIGQINAQATKGLPKINHRNKIKIQPLVLIPNGTICTHPVKIDGQSYFVKSTCGFDALTHILMTSAVDDVNYANFLQTSSNDTVKLVVNLINDGVTQQFFRDRVKILKSFCRTTIGMQTKNRILSYTIDAFGNIANQVKEVLTSEPSVKITEICTHCVGRTFVDSHIAPNHIIIAKRGFSALEKALSFRSPIYNITCRNGCPGKYTAFRKPNAHILIELDIRKSVNDISGMKCTLRELPETLRIQLREETYAIYKLTGAISYVPGHFIAFCRRSNGNWQLYDDLLKHIQTRPSSTEIEPHLAVYIQHPVVE